MNLGFVGLPFSFKLGECCLSHLQTHSIRRHVHVNRNLALQQRAPCRPHARELRGVRRVPLQCAFRKAPQQQERVLQDRVQCNALLHLPTYRAAALRPGAWAEGIGMKPARGCGLWTMESTSIWQNSFIKASTGLSNTSVKQQWW